MAEWKLVWVRNSFCVKHETWKSEYQHKVAVTYPFIYMHLSYVYIYIYIYMNKKTPNLLNLQMFLFFLEALFSDETSDEISDETAM